MSTDNAAECAVSPCAEEKEAAVEALKNMGVEVDDNTPAETPCGVDSTRGLKPIEAMYESHLPIGETEDGKHCWSQLCGSVFKVRGKNYLKDKKKFHSEPSFLRCVGVELLVSDKDTEHLCERPDSFVNRAVKNGSKDFFFVYNIMIKGPKDCKSLISYYTVPSTLKETDPLSYRLFETMKTQGDDYINPHLKLIPGIYSGPWMVKKAVGNTPAIVGNKLRQVSYQGSNYLEVVLDVSSDKVAKTICGLAINSAKALVVDIGLVIEGQKEEDLPEHILGAYRLIHPHLEQCAKI
ncbi:hypothetical protein WA158_002823 [Blastocystis sp. Blastoise]